MVGIHDAYTYCEPKYKIFKLFNGLWKTQIINYLSYDNSYADIRVRLVNGQYRVCHGLVDFCSEYANLESLIRELYDFDKYYVRNHKVRIVLERGDSFDKKVFENDVKHFGENLIMSTDKEVIDELKEMFDCAIIKKDWKIIRESKMNIIDNTHALWNVDKSFWWNFKHHILHFKTIKQMAKNNIPITDEARNSEETVYYYDYVVDRYGDLKK